MARKIEHIEEIDRYVGDRIFKLRLFNGMCRQELAAAIYVTHQQLQKYEKGVNRISAGRLFKIAEILKTPVSYFFEEVENKNEEDSAKFLNQRKCMEVSRNFMRIKNEDYRNAINFLVRKLANSEGESSSNFSEEEINGK